MRESRWEGTCSASVVSHQTLNRARPTPATANVATSAAGGAAKASARTAIGHAQTATNAVRSGRSGRHRSARRAPMRVPAPVADMTTPYRAGAPYSLLATSVPSTRSGAYPARRAVLAQAMVIHAQGRARSSHKPSATSLAREALRGPVAAYAGTRVSSIAEIRNSAPAAMNGHSDPVDSASAVATSGPNSAAALSEKQVKARACWISAAATVCGNSPLNAGRKNPSATPAHAEMSASNAVSELASSANRASNAYIAARVASAATISGRRE